MVHDPNQIIIDQITKRVSEFMKDLVTEGDRAVVVLGAARIDVALETLLTTVMTHHGGGEDNLFDPDRPLGTFSAKISLTYRLGLVDGGFEHALQMLRKIRNEFAHSVAKASLSESHHKSRLRELTKTTRKYVSNGKCIHEQVYSLVASDVASEELRDFVRQ